MNKIKLIAIALFVQLSFVQCQNEVEVTTYEVTPEFAEKIDKPPIHFTVDIPKSLDFEKPEEGKKTYSYGMIRELNDEKVVTEMYSLSYIKLEGNASLEKEGPNFMKQIRDMLKSGGYELEEDSIGMLEFDGKKYLSLQVTGTIKEGLSEEFKGRYLFNGIVKPNPYGDTNIIMLMAARDDQVQTYEDFKDKLTISTLWKTFTYLK